MWFTVRKIRVIIALLWTSFIAINGSIILFFYLVDINYNNWFGAKPTLAELDKPVEELSSEVYSSDNVLLGKYYVTTSNRIGVEFDDIPKTVIESTLAAEDIRFYEHSGIDFISVVRAIVGRLTFQSFGGGSTITQQLAKNLFKTRVDKYKGKITSPRVLRTVLSKAKEWILSLYIERRYTKEEILTKYLNTVFFGNNSNGIFVASQTYFGIPADSLDYHQAALLVGLVNAPTRFDPVRNPEIALKKRNRILYQLYKYDFLSNEKVKMYINKPMDLNFKAESQSEGLATYFRTVAKNHLKKWTRKNGYNLYSDGLKIYTTIDSRMQKYAEKAVKKNMKDLQRLFYRYWKDRNPWIDKDGKEVVDYLDKEFKKTEHYRIFKKKYGDNHDSIAMKAHEKYMLKVLNFNEDSTSYIEIDSLMSPMDSLNHYQRFLQTGFMAMDPKNGYIKAWVGGTDHRYFKFDHVYQGRRQPGSTFKPFVYATAIEAGFSPCFEVNNVPVTFDMPGQNPPIYRPKNSSTKYDGQRMNLKVAMARSINQITAYIVKQVGAKSIVNKAKSMGIKSPLDPVPALCLGVSPVTIFEMVGAYAVFANKGIWNNPTWLERIEDKDGNIIYNNLPDTKQAMSEENAYIMLNMLKATTEVEGGTGHGLGWDIINENNIGAKTGTTQNGSDGWFMAATENIVVGSWVGGDTPFVRFEKWYDGQGARTALPNVRLFLRYLYNDDSLKFEKKQFEVPDKPLNVELDCSRYKQNDEDINETDSTKKPVIPRKRFDDDF